MQNWYSIFPGNKWLSIYVWVIFCLFPFFFIFRSSSKVEVLTGIILLLLFFISFVFSARSKSGLVYMWISFEIVINVLMTLLYGYVYLAIFTAAFIGHIRRPVGFFIIYGIHIAVVISAIVAGLFWEIDLFLPQLHFIFIAVLGTILLPLNFYNRHKRLKLENQLEDAHEKISELLILEERERISRDLHDILGQKLSLIGLKSDLASRLVSHNAEAAKKELHDIRQTASMALREVRELVSDMRSVKLSDELFRSEQLLKAAEMRLVVKGKPTFEQIPTIVETVLCMCMKEAVTNVVKHSQADTCWIKFKQTKNEYCITIQDNGKGIESEAESLKGNGLRGMRERLEFVNGSLQIMNESGTTLLIKAPAVLTHIVEVE